MPENTPPTDPLETAETLFGTMHRANLRLAMALDHAVSFGLVTHLNTEVLNALDHARACMATIGVKYLADETFDHYAQAALAKAVEAAEAMVPRTLEQQVADGLLTPDEYHRLAGEREAGMTGAQAAAFYEQQATREAADNAEPPSAEGLPAVFDEPGEPNPAPFGYVPHLVCDQPGCPGQVAFDDETHTDATCNTCGHPWKRIPASITFTKN